jgi:multidrug resistance efflux pump
VEQIVINLPPSMPPPLDRGLRRRDNEERPVMPRSATSDLVPPGFRIRSDDLPRSLPPRWMTWLWVAALCGTIVCLICTMLGPMDEFVLTQGVVRPADFTLAYPKVSGTVDEVLVTVGERVNAGQVLCRIDSADLLRERADLEAELPQAQAALAIADANLAATRAAPVSTDLLFQAQSVARQREIVTMRRELLSRMEQAGGLSLVELTRERLGVKSAEADLDRAVHAATMLDGGYGQAAIAGAEARRRQAEAQLQALAIKQHSLDTELERRLVRAPSDGVVVSRSISIPGEQLELGKPLFKISKGTDTQVRLYASEDRVDRIKPGMQVRFRSRSDPDRLSPFSIGRVVDVALDRDVDGAAAEHPELQGAYVIDITVTESRARLPLGAIVDAEVVIEKRPFWRLLLMRPRKQAEVTVRSSDAN